MTEKELKQRPLRHARKDLEYAIQLIRENKSDDAIEKVKQSIERLQDWIEANERWHKA